MGFFVLDKAPPLAVGLVGGDVKGPEDLYTKDERMYFGVGMMLQQNNAKVNLVARSSVCAWEKERLDCGN